jgi:hypothetical protein
MSLNLHLAIVTAASCGIGYLMVLAGLGKNALELRRRQRSCPSCGRIIEARARVCRACNS